MVGVVGAGAVASVPVSGVVGVVGAGVVGAGAGVVGAGAGVVGVVGDGAMVGAGAPCTVTAWLSAPLVLPAASVTVTW